MMLSVPSWQREEHCYTQLTELTAGLCPGTVGLMTAGLCPGTVGLMTTCPMSQRRDDARSSRRQCPLGNKTRPAVTAAARQVMELTNSNPGFELVPTVKQESFQK